MLADCSRWDAECAGTAAERDGTKSLYPRRTALAAWTSSVIPVTNCYTMTYMDCLLFEPLQPYHWLQNLLPYDIHGLPPAWTSSPIPVTYTIRRMRFTSQWRAAFRVKSFKAVVVKPVTSKLATLWYAWTASCFNHFSHTTDFKTCYLWQTWIVSCLNHFSHTTDFKTCYPLTHMDCLLLEPVHPYQWLIRYDGWDLRASGGQPSRSSFSRRLSSNQWLPNLLCYDIRGLPPALTTSVTALTSKLATYGRHGLPPALATSAIPVTSKLATLWYQWIASCLNQFSHTNDFKACYSSGYKAVLGLVGRVSVHSDRVR